MVTRISVASRGRCRIGAFVSGREPYPRKISAHPILFSARHHAARSGVWREDFCALWRLPLAMDACERLGQRAVVGAFDHGRADLWIPFCRNRETDDRLY